MATSVQHLWRDRKRWILFGLPWTFTVYTLTQEKLILQTGLFTTLQDEVRLYRILDLSLKRTLFQKMFGLGTITCVSGDKTLPEFELKNIKKPIEVKELLSNVIEAERDKKRVSSREYMSGDIDFDCDCDSDMHN